MLKFHCTLKRRSLFEDLAFVYIEYEWFQYPLLYVNHDEDFECTCLEKKGLGFPELEEVMFNYVLTMPQGTLEFKECWISREYVEG
ncbi:hypothetical protein ACUXG3_005646 [Bacillus thuringiensis]